jgi:hypothetical protein
MGTSAGYGGGLPRDATGARFYWQMALRSESQALPIAIIRYRQATLSLFGT